LVFDQSSRLFASNQSEQIAATVPGGELLPRSANSEFRHMRSTLFAAMVVLVGGVIAGAVAADSPNDQPGEAKPSAARLKGMKEALAEIEKGHLRQKEFALPAPAWFGEYLKMLREKCGVNWITVGMRSEDPKDPRAEIDGYNDVMRVEIEHRFGKDILKTLRQQAESDFIKARGKQ
jgi:hypothetical protein